MTDRKIIEKMIRDRDFRIALCRKSHYWFFHFYFGHYVTHKTADFQREMFKITEDEENKMAVIVAFRGSAKSTIFTLSYVLWSIMGKHGKKFVIILSQTQKQAKQHLMNIRTELEKNIILSRDLGPFREESDEWGGYSLVISKYVARISAASTEQSIRGIKHLQFRPDVIIADDVEDLNSVKNQESRDKTYNWFKGDVIPSGDINTKIIVIGNLLHEDSLLKRLQGEIKDGVLNGIYQEFPLLDESGKPLWIDKFPNEDEIGKEKMKVGNEIAWQREYMLTIIPDTNRVISPAWIHKYEELPVDTNNFMYAATGIDLAISESESACYTAMVSVKVYGQGEQMKIYVLPYPVNERMDSPTTLRKAKEISEKLGNGRRTELYIEDVGYQRALIQNLQNENYPAIGFPTLGQDKRARLATIAPAIENGTVLFPKQGAEILINQLIGFGIEKYNDLADALVIIVSKAIENNEQNPSPFPEQGNGPEGKPELVGILDKDF